MEDFQQIFVELMNEDRPAALREVRNLRPSRTWVRQQRPGAVCGKGHI